MAEADFGRALVGFNVALSPLAACLMGWRGANQQMMGAADMYAAYHAYQRPRILI